jgi:hypothetical protein
VQDLRHRLVHKHSILYLVHGFLATLLEHALQQPSVVNFRGFVLTNLMVEIWSTSSSAGISSSS